MPVVGKYVESGYRFVYTVKIPSDVMKSGSITEERRVFIPGDDFDNALVIAETIMSSSDGLFKRMVSLSPETRSRREDE